LAGKQLVDGRQAAALGPVERGGRPGIRTMRRQSPEWMTAESLPPISPGRDLPVCQLGPGRDELRC
jgi:hypothetical protein